jgi:hypothetical protein
MPLLRCDLHETNRLVRRRDAFHTCVLLCHFGNVTQLIETTRYQPHWNATKYTEFYCYWPLGIASNAGEFSILGNVLSKQKPLRLLSINLRRYTRAVDQQKRDANSRVVEMMLPLEMKKFQHPSAGSTELAAAG